MPESVISASFLEQHVVRLAGEVAAPVPVHAQREALPRAHPVHLDAAEHGARRAAGPSAAEQRDRVAPRCQPLENLVEVDFRPARERVLATLPVDDQYPQRRAPMRRARASSTPFTKRALCALP